MKLVKYKVNKEEYSVIYEKVKELKAIGKVKEFFLVEEINGYYSFDLIWNSDDSSEFADYEVIIPVNYKKSHGSIIDSEYMKQCCDIDNSNPVCENVDVFYNLAQKTKQHLNSLGIINYYGY